MKDFKKGTKHMAKRLFAIVLAATILMSVFPVGAYAQNTDDDPEVPTHSTQATENNNESTTDDDTTDDESVTDDDTADDDIIADDDTSIDDDTADDTADDETSDDDTTDDDTTDDETTDDETTDDDTTDDDTTDDKTSDDDTTDDETSDDDTTDDETTDDDATDDETTDDETTDDETTDDDTTDDQETVDQLQAQGDALLEKWRPYLDKKTFIRNEVLALEAGLGEFVQFCGMNGISPTDDQMMLYNLLASAAASTPIEEEEGAETAVAVIKQWNEATSSYDIVGSANSLQDAISNAGPGDLVALTDNAQGNVEIPKSISLDLGRFTYTGDLNITRGEEDPNYIFIENGTIDGNITSGADLSLWNARTGNITLKTNDLDLDLENTVAGTLTLVEGSANVTKYGTDVTITIPENCRWDEMTGTALICPGHEAVIEYKDDNSGELLVGVFDSFEEALLYAENDDTVRLLKDFIGAPIVLERSITLDLGGHTYTANESPAITVQESAQDAFIQNGAIITTTENGILVQNKGGLTLAGVTLDGTNLSYALQCAENSQTMLSAGTSLAGTIRLDSANVNVNLGGAALTNCSLEFDESVEFPEYPMDSFKVIKASDQDVSIPYGYIWDGATVLVKASSTGDAVAKDIDSEVEYSNLQTAVDNSTNIQLLADIELSDVLVVNKSIHLDINEKRISGEGIRFTYGHSTIENGLISGSSYTGDGISASLHLEGGSVSIQNMGIMVESCGVYVEGSHVNASSFTMGKDSGIFAENCGIAIKPRTIAQVPNSVTVNGGTIQVKEGVGIADLPDEGPTSTEESSPLSDYATQIGVYGGEIQAICGINHFADGPLTFAGGTIRASETGIYLASAGNADISGGEILAFYSGAQRDAQSGCAIDHNGSGALTISGSTSLYSTQVAVYHRGSGALSVTGGTIEAEYAGIYNDWYAYDSYVLAEDSVPPNQTNFSGGVIQNCETGVIHFSNGNLNISGGSIQKCETGLVCDEAAVISMSGGSIAGNYGVYMMCGTLNATGGSISGSQVGIYAKPYIPGRAENDISYWIDITVNGTHVAGTEEASAAISLYGGETPVRAKLLSSTISGLIYTDEYIGDNKLKGTTELYREKGLSLTAFAPREGDTSQISSTTTWVEAEGMERFVYGDGLESEFGLQITIQWLDDGNVSKMRPASQNVDLISQKGETVTISITGKTDTWTETISMDTMDFLELMRQGYQVSTKGSLGYRPEISINGGIIQITMTLMEPTAKTTTDSQVYYIKKVRTKHPYSYIVSGSSGSLLQTGQVNWPIPVMGISGLLVMAFGVYLLRRKKGRYEKR